MLTRIGYWEIENVKKISFKGCQSAYEVMGGGTANLTIAQNGARPLNKMVPSASGWAGHGPQETSAVFRARFWRSHRLLHFIACRVLGSPQRADDAIENCWLKACRNPPHFEYEGAFRSWLVRVLIDEALAILREEQVSTGAAKLAAEKILLEPETNDPKNELCC